jgi:hypothetical protein
VHAFDLFPKSARTSSWQFICTRSGMELSKHGTHKDLRRLPHVGQLPQITELATGRSPDVCVYGVCGCLCVCVYVCLCVCVCVCV